MKIKPIAPGLYKPVFDPDDDTPLTRAAQSWSWYNLEELTRVVNAQHEALEFSKVMILQNFDALCGLFQNKAVVATLLVDDQGGYAINYGGAQKYFMYSHRSDRECYIPVGWGKRILEVLRRGPVGLVRFISPEKRMPSLNAFDANDNFMFELPMGNIPILDPNKYVEI